MNDPSDFEAILFESIPLTPTEFRVVAETFTSRTRLSPGEARAAFFGIVLALLMPEDPSESIADSEVSIIEVFFTERPKDGWRMLDASIHTELTECWKSGARLPREGALLKRTFEPAQSKSVALKIA